MFFKFKYYWVSFFWSKKTEGVADFGNSVFMDISDTNTPFNHIKAQIVLKRKLKCDSLIIVNYKKISKADFNFYKDQQYLIDTNQISDSDFKEGEDNA